MPEEQELNPYDLIGGDEGVRTLTDKFYDYMELLDEAKDTLALHPKDLGTSREKLFMFLSGWLGGPQRYMAAFGHPRLRARHLPFAIGDKERDQWLLCMQKALDDMEIDSAFRTSLMSSFTQVANHMRNQ